MEWEAVPDWYSASESESVRFILTGSVEYTSTDGTLVFFWWIGSATSARDTPLLYALFCTLLDLYK